MAEYQYKDLIKQASHQMLGKEKPEGREDWMKVMNFIAWNLDFPLCLRVCYGVARLHNVPLNEEEIKDIVDFQSFHRETKQLSRRNTISDFLSDAAIQEADKFLKEVV